MTCDRVIGGGCIWKGISLMNVRMLAVSVSDLSSFKCQFNGEIIFH